MAKTDWTKGIFIGAILVLMVAYLGGFIGAVSQPVSTPQAVTEAGQACVGGQTQSWTFKAYDRDNTATAVTEATNLIRRVGDQTWDTFTAGTAKTGLDSWVGSDVEIVMGISTSDFVDNAYGQHFIVRNMPCVYSESFEMANDEIETSMSFTFYNADDNAAAEGWSANEVQTVSFKIQAGADEYFGNPYIPADSLISDNGNHRKAYPNVFYLTLNTTEWDIPDKIYLADGTEMRSIPTPGRVSAVSGSQTYSYEAPVFGDTITRIYAVLDTDDTTAPATDDTAGILAANYYTHSKTSELNWGVETDEQAAVGTDAADTATVDNT